MATSRSDQLYDVVVVGAGPGGLAAATRAAGLGASVALVDAGSSPGGQYWRHPAPEGGLEPHDVAYLHHDLPVYRALVAQLEPVEKSRGYFRLHHVWTLARTDRGFVVHAVDRSGADERAVDVHGRRLVLAPGAYDRQVPFPGWDLPGVLTAGAAQALLKGQGVVPGRRVLVAGTGPFLLPVAAGLADAGATVVGVHEAAAPTRWLRELRAVGGNLDKLREGAMYAAKLARHKVPVRTRSVVVAAHGHEALESVTIARVDSAGRAAEGSEQRLEVDTLAVGWGFTPQLELPLALGCEARVDQDGSLVCVVDEQQQTSVEGVYAAGEACGVGGAALAVLEGAIAGAAAAGAPLGDQRVRRRRAALRAFARSVQRAHPLPDGWVDRLEEDTVVCRCEEVTQGDLRQVVERLEVADARTAKLVARPGMGWCQGRVCGYATSCVVASLSGTPGSATGTGERPVAIPLTLGLLAREDGSGAHSDPLGRPLDG